MLPNFFTSLYVAIVVSVFVNLTTYLFFVDTNLVFGAKTLSYITTLIEWNIILYTYQTSFHINNWSLTDLFSLKAFWIVKPVWLILEFVIYFMNFGKHQVLKDGKIIQPNETLEILWLLPQCLIAGLCYIIITSWIKSRRSLSRYRPLVNNRSDIQEDLSQPKKQENSFARASIFSRVLTSWIYPLLVIGHRRPLQISDIEDLRDKETTEFQKKSMKSVLEKYLSKKDDKRALLKAMYTRFLYEIIGLGIVGLAATLMDFSGAIFIKLLEAYLEGDQPYWRGFALVSYMLLSKVIQAIANNQYRFNVSLLGAHIKSGLSSCIFEKSLSISPQLLSSGEKKGSANFTYAQIVNLMQVDLERIATGIPYSMRAIIWPMQWIIGIYLLYTTVGWQGGTAGIVMMAVLFGVNIVIARIMARIQKITMEKKDIRMKLCNELLNNIKVFKLYNWEKKIAEGVRKARDIELSFIRKGQVWTMWVIFLNWGTRNYLIMGVLITMTLSGITLRPGDIFAGIAVISILNMSIRLIPDIISNFLNMLVSLKRIQDYLQCREIVDYNDKEQATENSHLSIGMKSASFAWDLPEENKTGELRESKAVLKDLDLKIRHGEFVAVVGRVGCGKSSLLQALIQNMNFVRTSDESSMFLNGSIAYVSQEA